MNRLTNEQLWRLAVTTLDNNWRQTTDGLGHTVPSRTLYPHQWSWDAGFIAIGLARIYPARGWRDLRSLFSAQWDDGRVPHIVFDWPDGQDDRYFPGPDFWRSAEILAAPPPAPRAPAAARLHGLSPRLVAQQRYLSTRRNAGGAGLACIVHPWESGQDNSPAWDAALAAVPADSSLLDRYQRRDLAVSHESHRPTDADYSRYIAIAQAYRSYGYADNGPGERYPFLVECPAFNAILAGAEHALAELAPVVGADPGPHRERASQITETLVDRLFDPATGMFHARDLHTDQLTPVRTVGGLVPLILPELPDDQVKALLMEACSPRFGLAEQLSLPLPSYDLTAPDLDPVRYWRGPIWLNMNWLLWRGLREHGQSGFADALHRAMVETVRAAGCFEYFHTYDGTGVGTAEFSWTASLTLDLLSEPE